MDERNNLRRVLPDRRVVAAKKRGKDGTKIEPRTIILANGFLNYDERKGQRRTNELWTYGCRRELSRNPTGKASRRSTVGLRATGRRAEVRRTWREDLGGRRSCTCGRRQHYQPHTRRKADNTPNGRRKSAVNFCPPYTGSRREKDRHFKGSVRDKRTPLIPLIPTPSPLPKRKVKTPKQFLKLLSSKCGVYSVSNEYCFLYETFTRSQKERR